MVYNVSTKLQTIWIVYNTSVKLLLRFAAAIVDLAPLLCAKSVGNCHLIDPCLQGAAGSWGLAKHKASDISALLGAPTAVQEDEWFSLGSSVVYHLRHKHLLIDGGNVWCR